MAAGRGGERPVRVGVNKMRVNEVRPDRTSSTDHVRREPRVEIARAPQSLERNVALGERGVEGLGCRARVVEPEKGGVDPPRAKRRQQLEHVPLRAADPSDPLDVEDLHRLVAVRGRRSRSQSQPRTSATAARIASRKSKGAR